MEQCVINMLLLLDLFLNKLVSPWLTSCCSDIWLYTVRPNQYEWSNPLSNIAFACTTFSIYTAWNADSYYDTISGKKILSWSIFLVFLWHCGTVCMYNCSYCVCEKYTVWSVNNIVFESLWRIIDSKCITTIYQL